MTRPADSPRWRGLSLDAGGTLISPRRPVAETYLEFGRAHGVAAQMEEIRSGFRRAFATWEGPRYQGDGRDFWRHVVRSATGSDDEGYFELLYDHYARATAWRIAEDAIPVLARLAERGVVLAVTSNWDTRLRPLLEELGLAARIDALVISSEVGAEKPDRRIFEATCEALGCVPAEVLHIGDDPRADVVGARRAGIGAAHWGVDITSMKDLPGWF